jgi:UDP-glucuronate 4-epimerase
LNKEIKINYLPVHPADINITWADIRKAEQFLNYKPKTSLKDGLIKFINWWENDK